MDITKVERIIAGLGFAPPPGPPLAPLAGVTVSVDAPTEVAVGSNFTANVTISQVTDLDAGNFDVTFDPAVIELVDVTAGSVNSTTVPVDFYNENGSGNYTVVQNVSGLSGVSGSGTLAVLHFHVAGPAGQSSNITLSNGVLSNNLAEEIDATWTGDSVSIVPLIEDFTTYTEVDPNNHIGITSTRVTYTGELRNEDAYVYKDKGTDHFSGDFEHLLTVKLESSPEGEAGLSVPWMLSNAVDDLYGLQTANENLLGLYFYIYEIEIPTIRLYLFERDGSSSYYDFFEYSNWANIYYLKIKRDEAVG